MQYQVRFVEDSELPSGVDYVFASVANRTYLLMKQSAVSAATLTRSFTTWQRAQSVELKELAGAL